MIHTIRAVAVGDQESKIDSPIILYRGDREVEVEFTINGSKFTFTNGGNVIKSTNATHGQLVINTPTGENMFSEVTECHDGKVVFVITKEMIDELIEVGFYSFQIRLFDESQVSRVTIPPVLKGIDIRNPIAAEDETNVVDIGLVDYAVVVKDEFEDLSTFLPDGNYNKTEWDSKDAISGAKLNKIEDALYNINYNMETTDLALLNRVENINKNIHGEMAKLENELEGEVEQVKIDVNETISVYKNEISEELADIENKTYVNVKDFGAIGNGVYDDTIAIQNAFNASKERDVTIFFPTGVYKLTNGISISNAYNIDVKGNNSQIMLYNSSRIEGYTVFNISCLENKTVNVYNLNIDGENTQQDLFDNTDYYSTPKITGLNITANKINIHDSAFKNWYGSAIKLHSFRNVLVDNTQIKNVGGHWVSNNTYDAFGDAIYLGGRENADVIIENVCVEGKTREDGKVSRIGITVENLSDVTDIETNIYVRNSKFIGYDRCVHSEGNEGLVRIKLDHCILKAHVILMGWNNGIRSNGVFDNCDISFYKGDYNGAKGIAYQFGSVYVNNTKIDCAESSKNPLGMNGISLIMSNSIVDNVKSTMIENSDCKIYNSVFNISESTTTYLFYGERSKGYQFTNCIFNNIENTKILALDRYGSHPKFINCEFHNLAPKYINGTPDLDINSRIYLTSSVTGFTKSYYYNQNMTVYMDGKPIIKPNLCGCFPMKDNVNRSNCYSVESISSDLSIPLLPTEYFEGKIIIIIKGNNGEYQMLNGSIGHSYGAGVYCVTAYWKDSKYVIEGDVKKYGYDPAICGMQLSIDKENNTINKSTYSAYVTRVEKLVLPYSYIDYLPFIF